MAKSRRIEISFLTTLSIENERESTPTLSLDKIDPCLQTEHARSPILEEYEMEPLSLSPPNSFARESWIRCWFPEYIPRMAMM